MQIGPREIVTPYRPIPLDVPEGMKPNEFFNSAENLNDLVHNNGLLTNPEGLLRVANNTYRISGNSGQPFETFAGDNNAVAILAGTLENSNVDLAKEFTDLIVAQRAFQANSRVVTTADEVLQELINLVG